MISPKLPWELMNPKLAAELNPVLLNPIVSGKMITAKLAVGTTTINHLLGKALNGWIIVGIDGAAAIYDAQASNPYPDLTVKLVSNAAVTVHLYVF